MSAPERPQDRAASIGWWVAIGAAVIAGGISIGLVRYRHATPDRDESATSMPMAESPRATGAAPASSPVVSLAIEPHVVPVEPGTLRVQVAVTNVSGMPLDGANISAIFQQRSLGAGAAGPDGKFVLDSVPDDIPVELTARKEGYVSQSLRLPRPPAGERVVEAQFELIERAKAVTGVFAGTVRNESGQPIVGAVVTYAAAREMEGEIYDRATTNAAGEYRLEVVASGLILTAAGEGWEPAVNRDAKPGKPGAPRSVDFILRKSRWIDLRVVDEKGAPLPDVVASLRSQGANLSFPETRTQKSDAQGRIRFDSLHEASMQLSLAKRGYYSFTISPAPLDQETPFVMQAAQVVKGRVMDAVSHAPIESYRLFVNGLRADGETEAMLHMSAMERNRAMPTAPARFPGGEFEMPINVSGLMYVLTPDNLGDSASKSHDPPNPIHVVVQADGYALLDTQMPAVDAGSTETPALEMRKAEPLRARIVSAPDSRPIAGAKVRYGLPPSTNQPGDLLDTNSETFIQMMRRPTYAEATSGSNGEVVLALAALDNAHENHPPPRALEGGVQASSELGMNGIVPGTLIVDAEGMTRTIVSLGSWQSLPTDANGNTILELQPESSITVSVLKQNVPMPGVELRLRVTGAQVPFRGMADANGIHTWKGLAPGAYNVTAKVPVNAQGDTRDVSADIHLAEAEPRLVTLEYKPGAHKLHGQALDGDGDPLPGALIRLSRPPQEAPPPRGPATVTAAPSEVRTTDAEGKYEFADLDAGDYTLAPSPPIDRRTIVEFGARNYPVSVNGETTQDFRALKIHAVRGRVILPPGISNTTGQFQGWRVSLSPANLPTGRGPGALPSAAPRTLTSGLVDGAFTFQQRLKGRFNLTIVGPLVVPGAPANQAPFATVEIDTTAVDQDVGVFTVPEIPSNSTAPPAQ